MSDKLRAMPQRKQAERAKQLRDAIENVKRGVPETKTPRSFTDEAARKAKPGNR
jgi:hypothetical protein